MRLREFGMDWQQLLNEHHRWLRTVVYSRLRHSDAVDEVMQEVALAAVKQAAPLHDAQKAAPWLYRLAVRQVLLYRRRLGRQRNLQRRYQDATRPVEESPQGDPLDWMLADERQALVRQAIRELPPREMEILLLKYTEDWSYRQIAGHLGLSPGAVQSRLHRARRLLRGHLEALNVVEATR